MGNLVIQCDLNVSVLFDKEYNEIFKSALLAELSDSEIFTKTHLTKVKETMEVLFEAINQEVDKINVKP